MTDHPRIAAKIAAFLGAVAGLPGFKITVACRLADVARSGLQLGRLDPAGSGSPSSPLSPGA